jgi:predicted  nucleic acid-binding Zn-ribbon protein
MMQNDLVKMIEQLQSEINALRDQVAASPEEPEEPKDEILDVLNAIPANWKKKEKEGSEYR